MEFFFNFTKFSYFFNCDSYFEISNVLTPIDFIFIFVGIGVEFFENFHHNKMSADTLIETLFVFNTAIFFLSAYFYPKKPKKKPSKYVPKIKKKTDNIDSADTDVGVDSKTLRTKDAMGFVNGLQIDKEYKKTLKHYEHLFFMIHFLCSIFIVKIPEIIRRISIDK